MISIQDVIEVFDIKNGGVKIDKSHMLLLNETPEIINNGNTNGVAITLKHCDSNLFMVILCTKIADKKHNIIKMTLCNKNAKVELINNGKVSFETNYPISDIREASFGW